jgi:hypothetical protein
VPARRYTDYRCDGTTDGVEADGMWPEGAHLVFRYSEIVIMRPRSLVAYGCTSPTWSELYVFTGGI